MNKTGIEYLGHTLNLIIGCSGVGCAVRDKCWARAMAKRQKHRCSTCYGFEAHYHRERLLQPLKRKKPTRIGLNFMGETFDKQIVDHCPYIYNEIFGMIEKTHQHTFLILTKQPQNIPFRYFPENLELGVSVNRKEDLWRVKELLRHQAETHVVSLEPLYEDLSTIDLDHIEWVIVGAQTRPKLLPNPNWVTSLVVKTHELEIPIFMKDNLSPPFEKSLLIKEFPR